MKLPEVELNLTFAYTLPSRLSTAAALLLPESLRAFGGQVANKPLTAYRPRLAPDLPNPIRQRLEELHVNIVPFDLPIEVENFPFAAKVYAASLAEQAASDHGGTHPEKPDPPENLLIWMDHDILFVQEPLELQLQAGKKLACSPVHHTLIGSPYDSPLDPFWTLLYEHCQVDKQRVYPMTTLVDARVLRPYFNAGLLAVYPQIGLLRCWWGTFQRLLQLPEFEAFYLQSHLYQIFFHQAVLAGVILAGLDESEIYQFSPQMNYPLHLHAEYASDRRTKAINDLVTCRFEIIFDDPIWQKSLPVRAPLSAWITAITQV